MQLSKKQFFILILGIMVTFAAVTIFLNQRWILAVSPTPSMPSRIFAVDKTDKNIKTGDIVGFIYRGKKMYQYKNGKKFIKYVVCNEGDMLEVKGREYYCNGKYIDTAITMNAHGDLVENFEYNGIIPKGKFFTYTPYEYSYDSRYWGFADKKDVIGKGYGIF